MEKKKILVLLAFCFVLFLVGASTLETEIAEPEYLSNGMGCGGGNASEMGHG